MVANINVGILYLFAVSSLGVYGIIMGGWASNSKYPFLGALRSAAQMISYEVSIGFVIITVILLAGSMNLQTIVEHQGGGFWNWNVSAAAACKPPLALVMIPMMRDLLHLGPGRDQPPAVRPARGRERARGRLPGGIFLDALPAVHDLAEYANIVLMCALIATLFFGGWQAPWPEPYRTHWRRPGQLPRLRVVRGQDRVLVLHDRHGQAPSCPATATTS